LAWYFKPKHFWSISPLFYLFHVLHKLLFSMLWLIMIGNDDILRICPQVLTSRSLSIFHSPKPTIIFLVKIIIFAQTTTSETPFLSIQRKITSKTTRSSTFSKNSSDFYCHVTHALLNVYKKNHNFNKSKKKKYEWAWLQIVTLPVTTTVKKVFRDCHPSYWIPQCDNWWQYKKITLSSLRVISFSLQ